MARQKNVLNKIVALKRQSAEQRVQALQLELERQEAALRDLSGSLLALDAQASGFEALQLAEENGHASLLIGRIRAGQSLLVVKQAELRDAREALKLALYSEDRLGQISKQG